MDEIVTLMRVSRTIQLIVLRFHFVIVELMFWEGKKQYGEWTKKVGTKG